MMYLGAMAGWAETCAKRDAGFIITVGGRDYEWKLWFMEGVGGMNGYVALDRSDHVCVHQSASLAMDMADAKMMLEAKHRYGYPLEKWKPEPWYFEHLSTACFVMAGIFIFVTFCLPP